MADANPTTINRFGRPTAGTSLHTRYKMAMCLLPGDSGTDAQCLLQRTRPGMCPCEHHPFAARTQNDPQVLHSAICVL